MADHRTPVLHRRRSPCLPRRRTSRASWKSRPPSRWRPSATCRWPIRRAWRCRCAPSPSDPDAAYDYTAKGNLVAVISNGTAILGLGDLGALASKPVMEGKAVLFKRFADVDSIDLEVDTNDVDEFINAVRYLGPTFGGINLEDIKAPDCFIIEERLRELMDIPVFHDDQHGTAIISAAGVINAAASDRPQAGGHQGGGERRGRGGHRLPRTAQVDGRAERQRDPVRHQGRGLSRPHRRHEPVEIGACGRDQGAHAGRRAGRLRCVPRPVGQGRGDAGDGQDAWRRRRSSSPWPIPIRRSRRKM